MFYRQRYFLFKIYNKRLTILKCSGKNGISIEFQAVIHLELHLQIVKQDFKYVLEIEIAV